MAKRKRNHKQFSKKARNIKRKLNYFLIELEGEKNGNSKVRRSK